MIKLTPIAASPDDLRDIIYKPSGAPLPPFVDLRQYATEIEDQGAQGSCTANATTSAVELIAKRGGIDEDLSRQFNYYLARRDEGRLGKDGLLTLRSALHAGYKYGFCLESEWEHLLELAEKEPPASCFASAAMRKITRYERIQLNWWEDRVSIIKAALAEGLPVIIAMSVNPMIYGMRGQLAEQKYEVVDANGKRIVIDGYHAVKLAGYYDSLGGFFYANSWHKVWGDAGYGRLEYRHINELAEAWIVRGYRDIYIAPPVPVEPPKPVPAPPPLPVPAPMPAPPGPEVDPPPAPEPPAPEPVPPTPTPKKKSDKPALILGAILTIAILAIAYSNT